MKNLTTAIYTKALGSTLYSLVGGRFYKGRPPEAVTFPYLVYSVVTDIPFRTFSEEYENVEMQFSLFSETSSTSELEDMYTALKALYDEEALTIIGSTLVWMRRLNANFMVDEHTTPSGTKTVWAYHVNFDIRTSLD